MAQLDTPTPSLWFGPPPGTSKPSPSHYVRAGAGAARRPAAPRAAPRARTHTKPPLPAPSDWQPAAARGGGRIDVLAANAAAAAATPRRTPPAPASPRPTERDGYGRVPPYLAKARAAAAAEAAQQAERLGVVVQAEARPKRRALSASEREALLAAARARLATACAGAAALPLVCDTLAGQRRAEAVEKSAAAAARDVALLERRGEIEVEDG